MLVSEYFVGTIGGEIGLSLIIPHWRSLSARESQDTAPAQTSGLFT